MDKNYIAIRYNELLAETEKAWLLKLVNGDEVWFSKKYCNLRKGNLVDIPDWLERKIKNESSK